MQATERDGKSWIKTGSSCGHARERGSEGESKGYSTLYKEVQHYSLKMRSGTRLKSYSTLKRVTVPFLKRHRVPFRAVQRPLYSVQVHLQRGTELPFLERYGAL